MGLTLLTGAGDIMRAPRKRRTQIRFCATIGGIG